MYSLNENAVEDKLRRKFAEKFHVEIINFNDMSMALDVNFLYFSQSYISKLFDGESQAKLETFFEKEWLRFKI